MQFKSLIGDSKTSFKKALFTGVAPNSSLYIPDYLPQLSQDFLQNMATFSLEEMAYKILSMFIDDIPANDLSDIVNKAFNFNIPLNRLTPNIFLLELFHGPTLAFKDIGARFLAETLSYYLKNTSGPLNIVVATSGDTGSAVAQGFYGVPHINVFILYPKNKVSRLQEKQMTTLGKNIHALEIDGTFDDCQALVKQALIDPDLQKMSISTANSMNIGRLLPQIVYYFWGLACLQRKGFDHSTIVVPSGNFGNITAAAYAKAMGGSIKKLIAATNMNDVVPQYLQTGILSPQVSKLSLSNAMDVGYPNNLVRLQSLYKNDFQQLKENIISISVSDVDTLQEIFETYQTSQYILDPHTAVGVRVAKDCLNNADVAIVAATAHPGKFSEVIQQALGFVPALPSELQILENRTISKTCLSVDFGCFKSYLNDVCDRKVL